METTMDQGPSDQRLLDDYEKWVRRPWEPHLYERNDMLRIIALARKALSSETRRNDVLEEVALKFESGTTTLKPAYAALAAGTVRGMKT
jgi:hypothetical protein